MVLRGGKEVDSKVSEKKYDKEERARTNETDCQIESDSSPSSNVSDPVRPYKPGVPYLQALDAPFPSKKDKQRENILEIFKQVKVPSWKQ